MVTTASEEVGARLKAARDEAGLTGEQVGARLRCTKQTIYRYELGLTEARYDVLLLLARLYGVSAAWLLDPAGAREQGPPVLRRRRRVGRSRTARAA
jgi:transcriptional regulator with XRE-family HTH domain